MYTRAAPAASWWMGCAPKAVAGLGPRRSRRAYEERSLMAVSRYKDDVDAQIRGLGLTVSPEDRDRRIF